MACVWKQERGKDPAAWTPTGVTTDAAVHFSQAAMMANGVGGFSICGHPWEWFAHHPSTGQVLVHVWIEPSKIKLAEVVLPAKFLAPAGAPDDPNPRVQKEPK